MASEAVQKGSSKYHFLIVASCIAITCVPCALVISCGGIYYTPLANYFGVPRATVSFYFTVVNLAMMVTLPIAGKILSKVDVRAVMTAAVLFVGLSLLAMSQFNAVWQFYITGATLGIGCAPLLYLATPSLINAWFKKRVGFFLGLCMAFTGIGGVIFNPVGNAFISQGPDGWRMGYLVFGILALVITLPFTIFVLRSKPQEKGLMPYGVDEAVSDGEGAAKAAPAADWGLSAGKAMKTPAFYAVCGTALLFMLNLTVFQFMPSYCSSFEATAPEIAALAGIIASACMAGQAIGKVVLGAVNDKSPHGGLFLCIGCGFVGIALIWFLPTIAALLLFGAFVFGFVYAGLQVESPLITRTVFGPKDYTNIWSRVSMIGSLGGIIAPTLFGVLVDLPNGFSVMFTVSFICMGLLLVLGLFALGQRDKVRKLADEEA